MQRRWLVNRTNPEFVDYLSRASSISPVLAQVLINRGIKDSSSIHDFLNPSTSGLSDPFEMAGMKAAVDRIKGALKAGEKVLVHGDYDTDGLTATAIIVHTLRTAGLRTEYFIPSRADHGYGFNKPAVELAERAGASVILTVDCGISSLEGAAYAKAKGIDVIITDHHEPSRKSVAGACLHEDAESFELPEAVSIINPKLTPSSPLSNLSGAGIAFKLAQALALDGSLRFSQDDLYSMFDLAALGTIADVVPLTGENRIIMKEGLKLLNGGARPGIRALKSVSRTDSRQIKAGLLSFTIVPRINAAGRMGDSKDVVRLLLSTDEAEAEDLSRWLDGLNSSRQKVENDVYQDALSRINRATLDSVIVLSEYGWHPGVLGIVASRVAEEFCCPAFIFTIEDGIAKGSARSIPSFDICGGLSTCSDLLLGFGGHKQAAGIRLKHEDIGRFEDAIRRVIKDTVPLDDLVPSLEIDADVKLSDITHGLVNELDRLEPFGYGNPEPLFGSKSLEVLSPRTVGNNHLKMRLKRNSAALDSIAFDMADSFEGLNSPEMIDVVYTPSINEWNGGRYIQLVVKALRPSGQAGSGAYPG